MNLVLEIVLKTIESQIKSIANHPIMVTLLARNNYAYNFVNNENYRLLGSLGIR